MKTSAGRLALLVLAAACTPPQGRAAPASHADALVRDSLVLEARLAYADAWLTCLKHPAVRRAVRRAQHAYVDTMTYEQITSVTDADALRLVMAVHEQHCGPRPSSRKEP
jgi:hypothetical protein